MELDHGSLGYMAPEILLPDKRPLFATIQDLKAADMWALGMVMFVLANPSSRYPYSHEIEAACVSLMTSREALEELLRNENDHPHLRNTKRCRHITGIGYSNCMSFAPILIPRKELNA